MTCSRLHADLGGEGLLGFRHPAPPCKAVRSSNEHQFGAQGREHHLPKRSPVRRVPEYVGLPIRIQCGAGQYHYMYVDKQTFPKIQEATSVAPGCKKTQQAQTGQQKSNLSQPSITSGNLQGDPGFKLPRGSARSASNRRR